MTHKEIIVAYNEGESILSLSKKTGHTRATIRKMVEASGILRTRGEQELLKWARMSPQRRASQYAAAHTAAIGRVVAETELSLRAATKEKTHSKIGEGERQLAKWLSPVKVVPQLAVGPYNLDLALVEFNMVIEVHLKPNNPLNDSKLKKRTAYLQNKGWRVCYVWVTRKYPLNTSLLSALKSWMAKGSSLILLRGNGSLVR